MFKLIILYVINYFNFYLLHTEMFAGDLYKLYIFVISIKFKNRLYQSKSPAIKHRTYQWYVLYSQNVQHYKWNISILIFFSIFLVQVSAPISNQISINLIFRGLSHKMFNFSSHFVIVFIMWYHLIFSILIDF